MVLLSWQTSRTFSTFLLLFQIFHLHAHQFRVHQTFLFFKTSPINLLNIMKHIFTQKNSLLAIESHVLSILVNSSCYVTIIELGVGSRPYCVDWTYFPKHDVCVNLWFAPITDTWAPEMILFPSILILSLTNNSPISIIIIIIAERPVRKFDICCYSCKLQYLFSWHGGS